ncbi:MAG: PHP domain-containing protein [Candidatus Binatia bacterium]
MARGADLHLHSSYSDGTFTPREVVAQAARQQVSPIALTDHDTVAGIPEALQAGVEMSVEVIPGVELSAHEEGHDIHIIGYFIEWEAPKLQRSLDALAERRLKRVNEIVKRLTDLGCPICLEDVQAVAGHGTISRRHVARVLVSQGYARSISKAFDFYLAPGKPAHVDPVGFSSLDAIDLIGHAQGISALAHPMRSKALSMLPHLVNQGIKGLEVYHPSHTTEDIFILAKYAHQHNLIITGGSDSHGEGTGGSRIGNITLPQKYADDIKKCGEHIRKTSRK